MKKLLYILLLLPLFAVSQTTNFTFATWPLDSTGFQNPGRGIVTRQSVAAWDNTAANGVQAPTGATVGKTYTMRLNLYNTQFGAGTSPNAWTWAISSPNDWQGFDWGFKWAIDRNMLVGLAITDIVDAYDPYNAAGAQNLSYPTWLHDSMQLAALATDRDTLIANNWIPNWNSPIYQRFYERLLDTFSRFINNTTYSGVPYSKVVQYLDIRSFGNTGEWHNAGTGFSTLKAANRLPTVATYKRMLRAYTTYFPNTELIYIMNLFDDDGSSEIPAEVVSFALDSLSNTYGPLGFGYRRDNWGQSTFDAILLNSSYNYSGSLRIKIRDIWKKGRITGEPSIDGANVAYPFPGGLAYGRMAIEADSFHMSMLENGNWASYSTQMGDTIRLAEKRMGYKYNLTAGSMPTTPTKNANTAVSISWHNLGVAPMYDRRFKIRYKLYNSVGTLKQTLNSSLQLYLQHNDTTHVDQLVFTDTCTNCSLKLSVIDSLGYITAPIKLSITQPAQNGDGSYTLRSSFNITAAIPAKITGIVWRDCVNMSGGFKPYSMFDETANIDPEASDFTPQPVTRDLPYLKNQFFVAWNNESRMYVKLRATYRMTKIWYYVDNTFFADSIIVYKRKPSILTPLSNADVITRIYIPASQNGWQSVILSGTDTCTALTFGFKGDWSNTYQVASRADVNEIVLYGELIGSRAAAPANTWTGGYRARKTMNSKWGDNNGSGYFDMQYAQNNTAEFREGLDGAWLGGSNLAWPNNTINQNFFGDYPSNQKRLERYTWDSLSKVGVTVFPFFHRAYPRILNAGKPAEYWLVDSVGADPFNPQSWKIHADVLWHYAKMYGTGSLNDTLNLKTYGIPKYSGLGLINKIEANNEIDYLSRGCDTCNASLYYYPPFMSNIADQMAYDGFELRYGPRIGIKVADATIKLMGSGTIGFVAELEHDRVSLSKDTRTDGANIYAWHNAHYYPNNGTSGIHPVEFNLRAQVDAYIDSCYLIDSTMLITVTELGYDASSIRTPPPGSQYTVLETVDTYTDRQKQANVDMYAIGELWASRLDAFNMYTFYSNDDEANNGSYATSGKYVDFPATVFQNRYYTEKQLRTMLGNFIYDSTVSYSWQNSYVVKGHAGVDSVCAIVGKPSNSGLTGNISVYVGNNKVVKMYDPSYTTLNPTVTNLTVTAGYVSVPSEDKLKWLIITTTPGQQQLRFGRRFRTVVNN